MNALDQAFIKAFAKNRTVTAESKEGASQRVSERFRPPAENVESGPLLLPRSDQHDQRWRLDRPLTNDATLDSHLTFPVVESLEADQSLEAESTKEGDDMAEGPVAFEDHCRRMDSTPELIQPVHFMDDPTLGVAADRAVAELDGARQSEKEEATESRGEHRVESVPEVFWVAMELQAPELMTHQFGGLEHPNAWPLNAGLSTAEIRAEISEPGVDLAVFPDRNGEGTVKENGQPANDPACPETKAEPEPPLEWVGAVGGNGVSAPAQSGMVTVGNASDSAAAESGGNSDANSASGETECGSERVAEEAVARIDTELDVSSSPPPGMFAPAWEVDAFRWPDLCRQWDEQTGARLEQAGQELFAATQDGLKVLAVTSSSRLEGRTTVALALARSAMLGGANVALVDADFGNPELARRLGMEAPCDWREVVERGESLSEAAVTSLGDRVTLFPKKLGEAREGSGSLELLLSILSEPARCFDLVVVDLSPALSQEAVPPERAVQAIGETLKSCPIDMAVVVRDVRETPRDQCMETVSSLRGLGIQAVGVIENYTRPSDVTVCHRTRPAGQPSESRCQA